MGWEAGALEVPRRPALISDKQRLALILAVGALGIGLGVLPPVFGFGVLAGLAAFMLASYRPTWAIGVALAAIPLELFVVNLGPVGLTPVQIAVFLAVVMMFAEMLAVGRYGIPKTSLDVWILVWLATGFLGAIGAYDSEGAIKKAGMTVIFVGFYYLVVKKVRRTETISMLMKVLVASCSVVGAYGVWLSYRYLSSGATAGKAIIVGSEGLAVPRAGSTLGQPTVLAALMVVALPIAVTLVATTKGWERILTVLGAATVIVTLGFTFTRGAWLGGLVGMFVLAFERRTRNVLVVIALLLVFMSPQVVLDRATSSTNTGRAEISHRFDFWRGALLVAEQKPIFGVGIGNFRYNYSRLPVPETALYNAIHPHNFALDLLADTGIVGLISFGGVFAGALVLLLRRRRADPDEARRMWRLAVAAAILGTLAHQTTDSLLLEPTWNTIIWMLFGLAVVMAAGASGPDDGFMPSRPEGAA